MKKLLTLALSLALTAAVGVASANTKLVVGASATPHAEILEAAKPILAEKASTLKSSSLTITFSRTFSSKRAIWTQTTSSTSPTSRISTRRTARIWSARARCTTSRWACT